jgi:hypothetical protein
MKITIDVNLEKGALLAWDLQEGINPLYHISEVLIIGEKAYYKTDNVTDYKNSDFRTEKQILEDYRLAKLL